MINALRNGMREMTWTEMLAVMALGCLFNAFRGPQELATAIATSIVIAVTRLVYEP